MVRESLHRPSITDEESEMIPKESSASPSFIAAENLEPVSTSLERGDLTSRLDTSKSGGEAGEQDAMTYSMRRPSLDEEIQSTIDELKCNSLSMRKCSSSKHRSFSPSPSVSCHGSSNSDMTSNSTITIKQGPSLFSTQDVKGRSRGSISVKPSTLSLPALAAPISSPASRYKTPSFATSSRLGSTYQLRSPFQASQSLSKSLDGRKDLIGADEEENLVDRAVQEDKFSGRMKSEEMAVLQMLDQMSCSTDSMPKSYQCNGRVDTTFARPKPARMTPKKVVSTFSLPDSPSRMSVKAVANAVNQGGRQSPFQSPSKNHLSVKADDIDDCLNGGRSSRPGGVKKAVMERELLDQSCCPSPSSEIRSKDEGLPDPASESYAGIGTYMARYSQHSNSVSPTRLSTTGPKRQVFQRQESEASINSSYASQTNAFLTRRPTHAADRRLTHSPKSSVIFSSADESTSSFWSRRKGAQESPVTDATTPGFSSESDFGPSKKVPRSQQKLLVQQIEEAAVEAEPAVFSSRSDAMADKFATVGGESSRNIKVSSQQSPVKSTAIPLESPSTIRTTVVSASSFLSNSQTLSSSLSEKILAFPKPPTKLSTPTRAKDLIRLYESNNDNDKAPVTPTKMTPSAGLMSPLTNPHVASGQIDPVSSVSPLVGPPVPLKQKSQGTGVGMTKVTPRKAVNYSLLGNAAATVSSGTVESVSVTPAGCSIAAPTLQISPSPSKSSLPYLAPTPDLLGEERDDFGPPSPPSDVQFSWPSDTDAELVPADSASQRVARTPTMSSHFTALPQRRPLRELRIMNPPYTKTPAQRLRDDVVSDLKLASLQDDGALSTVPESVLTEQFSTPQTDSYGDQMVASTMPSSPLEQASSSINEAKGAVSNTSSQDVALVLQFLERQQQEREQREALLDAQLRSFQDTLLTLQSAAAKEASLPIEREVSSQGSTRTSQAIQTPVLEDHTSRSADLATVLQAIQENEKARESQQKQQHEIARYLNELNSWLERDVVDRTNEWKTLAMGVTKLHEELNQLKTGQAIAATSIAYNLDGASSIPAHPDGAIPIALETGGQSGPRIMRVAENNLSTSFDPQQQQHSLQDQMMAVGMNPPAPIVTPGPSGTIKRSGTRTWRAEAAPGAMRNNDVWAGGPIKVKEKQSREEKKAEGRARRRSAFIDSSVGRIALAAGGAALLQAATHEYEKYKERQRSEGKPEDSSSSIDEKTGTYVQKEEVPEAHIDQMKEAIIKGDESKIREAVKGAAEVGAGTAALKKLMDWIKGGPDHDDEDAHSSHTTKTDGKSEGSQGATRSAKSSAGSEGDDTSRTLREAVESMSSVGGGGAALALAVEEILKHLLEKKEEEKRLAKEEAEAEAAKEAKRKAEEEEKEKKMMAIREQEKHDLVETILAKLHQEKARQEQEAIQKQHELDPKSAIESLVVAINQQRAMDAAQHANADAAIKQLASEVVRTSTESSGQLVEAVHAAAREMLRQNIESHAEELKNTLTKEVSTMFEDVGKIRETKRSLEQEIADLFLIKSKHLSDVATAPAPAPQDPTPSEVGARAAAPTGAPLFPAISNIFRPPTTVPMSKPLPHPQAPAQWCPPSLQPAHQAGASSHPPLNAQELQMLNQASFAMPPSASMSQPKRDLIGPLSINFGPRRK